MRLFSTPTTPRPSRRWNACERTRAALPSSLILAAILAASSGPLALGAGPSRPEPREAVWQLDNGLRLIVRNNPASATLAASAAVHVAATQEEAGQYGLRRLAQLCLVAEGGGQGSETYEFGGYVEPDLLVMSVQALADDGTAPVRALLKGLIDAHFESETIRAQQRLMIRQYEASREVPMTAARVAGLAALYPASAEALAPEGARMTVLPSALQSWFKAQVLPNRVTLAVSGRVDPAEVRDAVEEATATWLPGPEAPPATPGPQPAIRGPLRTEMYADQSVVWIGARGPRRDDDDYPVALVAMVGLAHGMGSRLFRRVRDELGLAYTVDGQVVNGSLWPYMFVVASCEAPNVSRVSSEVTEELGRLAVAPLTPAELDRARRYADMELLRLRMSDPGAADFLSAEAAMLPTPPKPDALWQLSDQIQAVGADRVQAFFAHWWHAPSIVQIIGRQE